MAAASFAPFVAAASPQLLGIDRWEEVTRPLDLERALTADAYAKWQSFRDSEDARFVALTMPRVLARPAYGQAGDGGGDPAPAPARPADPQAALGFRFDASVLSPGRDTALWISAAWVYAQRVADSFAKYGLPSETQRHRGRGPRRGMAHAGIWWQCGVRRPAPGSGWSTRRSRSPSRTDGLPSYPGSGSCHWPPFGGPVPPSFFDNPACARPRFYASPEASALAAVSARLPYTLTVSRFAHYIKAIARDRIGWPTTGREGVAAELNAWIQRYVSTSDAAGERGMQCPLTDARVEVVPDEGRLGCYCAHVWLRLRERLEGPTASLREVVDLPPRASDQPTSARTTRRRASGRSTTRGDRLPNWLKSIAPFGTSAQGGPRHLPGPSAPTNEVRTVSTRAAGPSER